MALASRRSESLTAVVFVVCSLVLHAALYFSFETGAAEAPFELELPNEIELGLLGPDPGAEGAPAPAAAPAVPPAPTPPVPRPVERPVRDVPVAQEGGDRVVDAGAPEPALPAAVDAVAAGEAAAATGASDGDGLGGIGSGLGFGAGGFGSGSGGPPGAVIALHADLDRIRSTSLILEVSALLEIIPEWERLLQGSGLDALHDFSRVFVATPNLKRSGLVVSGRIKGGAATLKNAADRLAAESGQRAEFGARGGLSVAHWFNHGPTERDVALVGGGDQFVIARPADVGRALAVSAALAQRHAAQRDMEHASGAGALLAMYEGEAAALSVEGVREFVTDGDYAFAPLGVRMSLHPIDEFTAHLRVHGYYESAKAAQSALPRIESVRISLIDHPRAKYLGLRAAIEECKVERAGDTITLSTALTMHQIRYLMAFVSRALKPRD